MFFFALTELRCHGIVLLLSGFCGATINVEVFQWMEKFCMFLQYNLLIEYLSFHLFLGNSRTKIKNLTVLLQFTVYFIYLQMVREIDVLHTNTKLDMKTDQLLKSIYYIYYVNKKLYVLSHLRNIDISIYFIFIFVRKSLTNTCEILHLQIEQYTYVICIAYCAFEYENCYHVIFLRLGKNVRVDLETPF